MPARPCLGYPSMTAAATALIGEGLSFDAVAERIGITPPRLAGLVGRYGTAGYRTRGAAAAAARSPREAKTRDQVATVTVSLSTLERLRPHARRRDLSVEALVRAIVDVVALEEMVDAVLDDGEGV